MTTKLNLFDYGVISLYPATILGLAQWENNTISAETIFSISQAGKTESRMREAEPDSPFVRKGWMLSVVLWIEKILGAGGL